MSLNQIIISIFALKNVYIYDAHCKYHDKINLHYFGKSNNGWIICQKKILR